MVTRGAEIRFQGVRGGEVDSLWGWHFVPLSVVILVGAYSNAKPFTPLAPAPEPGDRIHMNFYGLYRLFKPPE